MSFLPGQLYMIQCNTSNQMFQRLHWPSCKHGLTIISSWPKGKRYCLPHSSHDPPTIWWSPRTGINIEIHAKEILNLKKSLNKIYEKHTNQSLNTIEKMMDRDYFMNTEEAKKFGIVDKVVSETKC